jgi:glycosidase
MISSKCPRSSFLLNLLVSVVLVLVVGADAQERVRVNKVEPPNWWAALPENPMLLVYGTGFENARVTTQYPGVTVERVEPGNPGYVFVWLKIAPGAKPGTAKFVVTGKAGSATFAFPLLRREGCDRKIGRSEETSGPSTTAGPAQAQDDTAPCHAGLGKEDVMYLIMPDRFANGNTANDDPETAKGHYDRQKARAYHGGDLKGVEQHLPYLQDLGVTALWLTPFWKNDSNSADYHGYHVTDFYGVDEHFGSIEDFRALVVASHADGIKFFFDYVVNHIGPYHVWAQNPPLSSWLHGSVANHPKFDYHFEHLVDPHAPKQEWENITEGWFPTSPPANALPDLNVDDPHVAKYLVDNAIWWTETGGGLDGYRLDTFPYSSRKFWSYWHRELFRVYPKVNTIGEVYNFDPTITSFFQGGQKQWDGVDDGLSTMFDFPLQGAIRDVLVRNKPADSLPKIMRFDNLYLRPEGLVTFLGNHDTKRIMSEEGMTPQKLKAGFGLLMTLRGIPQIYYGDEIGMSGGDDPDNRRDFPGGWNGDPQNAFTEQGRTPEQQEMLTYVRGLIKLRKEHSALREGHQWTIGAGEKYFAFLRDDGKEKILVVFNEGAEPIKLELRDTPMESAKGLELLSGEAKSSFADGAATIESKFGVSAYRVK